jgi:hypothetical protein
MYTVYSIEFSRLVYRTLYSATTIGTSMHTLCMHRVLTRPLLDSRTNRLSSSMCLSFSNIIIFDFLGNGRGGCGTHLTKALINKDSNKQTIACIESSEAIFVLTGYVGGVFH